MESRDYNAYNYNSVPLLQVTGVGRLQGPAQQNLPMCICMYIACGFSLWVYIIPRVLRVSTFSAFHCHNSSALVQIYQKRLSKSDR